MTEKDYVTDKRPAHVDGVVMPDGTRAPQCLVLFSCPHVYPHKKKRSKRKVQLEQKCLGNNVLDAFLGPPRCEGTEVKPHSPTFMIPVRLLTQEEIVARSEPQQVLQSREVPRSPVT